MSARTGRAPAAALVALIGAVLLTDLVLVAPLPAAWDGRLLSNLAAVVVPAAAAACGWWRATRSTGRRRQAWSALAAAMTCWAVGDALWAGLEASGRTPFPSIADVAYLAFGPLVCVGLLRMPTDRAPGQRVLNVLDGIATSGALLTISLQTALGAALHGVGAERMSVAVVALAYPLVDVAVAVVAVITLARAPVASVRLPLALLTTGLVVLSVADSWFVLLAATDTYDPGDLIDLVWNAGLGCLGLAALLDRREHPEGPVAGSRRLPGSGGLLPYVPVAAVLAVTAVMMLDGRLPTLAEELAAHGLVVLVLVRQALSLRQNSALAARVAAGEQQLRHLAFHDALTGLPNRALFLDRLERALLRHARERHPVGLLFIDLDGFKSVNDTRGHAAGDALLRGVAGRVRDAVRAADTVARLGGDEFAVVLESGDDPRGCARRIADALRDPFPVPGGPLRARASVGVVELATDDPAAAADELVARADAAMYAIKRNRSTTPHVAG